MKIFLIPAFLTIFPLTSFEQKPHENSGTAHKAASHNFISYYYQELPLGSIKPKGWLLRQLQIMRDGTTGHLDEVHDKLKISNGWLGGTGDGWEETPYWLDGAVPLAYLLDDDKLKQKVLKYINWTIDNLY